MSVLSSKEGIVSMSHHANRAVRAYLVVSPEPLIADHLQLQNVAQQFLADDSINKSLVLPWAASGYER